MNGHERLTEIDQQLRAFSKRHAVARMWLWGGALFVWALTLASDIGGRHAIHEILADALFVVCMACAFMRAERDDANNQREKQSRP